MMKTRILKFLRVLLFLAAFLASAWFFLPWRPVGEAALSAAQRRLEAQGMRLSFSGVDAVDGGFRVNDVALSGFARFSFESLTFRPQLLSSLLAVTPVFSLSFKAGGMFLGSPVSLGDGEVLVTASPEGVLLERLRSNGDFAINGFIAINPAQMRISRAEAALDVPASLAENMETLKAFLPLVQEGDGRWFLRREEPPR